MFHRASLRPETTRGEFDELCFVNKNPCQDDFGRQFASAGWEPTRRARCDDDDTRRQMNNDKGRWDRFNQRFGIQ